MKNSGFENIDAGIRSVILISVAAAFFSWDIGFEFGVYGEIFFEKVFVAWSVSLALLIIFIIIPKKLLPVPPSLWAATAIPTLWLCIALANRAAPDDILFRHALTVLGFLAVLACIPYVAFVIISVLYPEFTRFKSPGPRLGIMLIVIIMVVAGYLIGSNHDRFLTCDDFKLSGHFVPVNCSDR
jgi:hypothetical protein